MLGALGAGVKGMGEGMAAGANILYGEGTFGGPQRRSPQRKGKRKRQRQPDNIFGF